MWKKDIHRTMQEDPAIPDDIADISVQTAGRRVDALNEADLLEPEIITPDGLNRDLIIAYELSPAGKDAIREKRESVLRDHLSQITCLDEDTDRHHNFIAALFADELGLDSRGRALLYSCSGVELNAFIAVYLLQRDVSTLLSIPRLEDLAEAEPVDALVDQLASLHEQHV